MTFKMVFPENNIGNFQSHISVLINSGFEVDPADTVSKAKKLVSKFTYDAAIVDDIMGNDSGLAVIPDILRKNPKAPIVVFSAYKGPEDRERVLDSLGLSHDTNLLVTSKASVRVSNGSFKELADQIYNACEDKELHLAPKDLNLPEARQKFAVSFATYERMSPSQRISLVDEFKQEKMAQISELVFKKRFIWALFMGDEKTPTATAKTFDEIWDHEKVLVEARKKGKFPFQVVSGSVVEDEIRSCGFPEFENYPKVAFQFDALKNSNGGLIEAHLDTGSKTTYLNGQWLLENGVVAERPIATLPKFVNGNEVEVAKLPKLKAEVQNRGTTSDGFRPPLNIEGWGVFSPWKDFPIASRCKLARDNGHDCGRSGEDDICEYRQSVFFGRNLYIDNNVVLSICPIGAETSFLRISKPKRVKKK